MDSASTRRRREAILAPTMTGDPYLERCIRAHANTLEWMPIFLPAMWLYAVYLSPTWAAVLGSHYCWVRWEDSST